MPEDGPAVLSARVRWKVMVVSLFVTASSFLFINGIAFLIPSLEATRGTPLAEAGLLSSMPSWGMVVTLVLWGYVLDRVGERLVLTLGSGLTAAAAYAAASVHSMVLPTKLVPPGLETKARLQSVRRHRWWQAVRSHG